MIKLSARRNLGFAVLCARFLLLAVAANCLAQTPITPDKTKTDPIAYLNGALDAIQARALRRDNVDWPHVRAEAMARGKNAQTTVDTYDAIRYALAGLRNYRSVLRLTPELQKLELQRNPRRVAPRLQADQLPSSPFAGRSVPEGRIEKIDGKVFALVVVPKCTPENERQFVDYATRLQRIITDLDRSRPRAWVVDLRGNGGNNMWPMLEGIGPVLGEGDHLGEFFTTRGHAVWQYRDGAVAEILNGSVHRYPRVEGTPYKLAGTPTVAVLIDSGTASAGEAIAIAFRGRPQTRFFGEYTARLSIISETVALPDGASLSLVTSVQADRNGKEYLDGLGPDEMIPHGAKILPDDQDQTLQGALWWLSHLP